MAQTKQKYFGLYDLIPLRHNQGSIANIFECDVLQSPKEKQRFLQNYGIIYGYYFHPYLRVKSS